MARTGLVLAAGFGSRLRTDDAPDRLKPLTVVGGRPLMLRTLDTLAAAGCDRVVVVLGYGADRVRAEIEAAYEGPLPLAFVVNERYELANGVSVLAARDELGADPFLLTMADHVFGPEIARLARAQQPPEGGAALFVDRKLDSIFDMDDATKVRTDGEHILRIGKELPEFDAVDTGLFLCTSALLDALQDVLDATGDASLSQGVAALAARGAMTTIDVGPGFWQDVDTPEMLAHAEHQLARREP